MLRAIGVLAALKKTLSVGTYDKKCVAQDSHKTNAL
jgi:hypothetical protein